MPLDLPKPEKKAIRVPKQVQDDALSPEDRIEYSITEEVSPRPGRKAWIKYGVGSAVRGGETTEQANSRVVSHVNQEIERRISELS